MDWKVYVEHFDGDIRNKDMGNKMSDILKSLSILSTNREGNWEIVTYSDNQLNPCDKDKNVRLYFTRGEDAQKYVKLTWFYPRFGWYIRQIIGEGRDIVFKKKEVIENIFDK